MNENVMDQHFHLPRNVRKDFRVPLWQPIHKRLLPQRRYLNKSGGSKQKQTIALHQG